MDPVLSADAEHGAAESQEQVYACPLNLEQQPPDLLHEEIIGQATNAEFIKSAKFSPDGNVVLTCSESNYMAFWKVSESIQHDNRYFATAESTGASTTPSGPPLKLFNAIGVGESIYDCAWYPHMSEANPATCCVLVSSRDHPMQLWDMITGEIRCKYTGYDHMDEIEAAQSLSFNLAGDKIYGGANRVIRIFDAANPGRQETNVATCKTRRDKFGQKGIISAISFCPDYSGVYGVGSFSQSVALYAENTNKRVAMVQPLGMGVTHLRWSPCGHYLWAGGRKSSDIVCIDIRMTKRELGRVSRTLTSNQRISFDLDPWGKYLMTGTQDGDVLVYDTAEFKLLSTVGYSYASNEPNLVRDCVNATTIHPYCSLAVTTTGQRHFDDTFDDDDEETKMELSTAWYSGRPNSGQPSGAASSKDSLPRDNRVMKYSSGVQLWKLPKF